MDAEALSEEDLACPICMERLRDPFVTPCGHSFCYSCITTHLQVKAVCPSCASYLTPDKVFPNYLLSKVVTLAARAEHRRRGSVVDQLRDVIDSGGASLKLTDLDALLELIDRKRSDMEAREKENSLELLLHFLTHFRESKTRKLRELQGELSILNGDISQVESQQAALPSPADFLLLPGLAEAANGAAGPSGRLATITEQLDAGEPGLAAAAAVAAAAGASAEKAAAAPAAAAAAAATASGPDSNGGAAGPSVPPPPPLSPGLAQPLLPGRRLAASSLFQSNGQHISTRALDLDLLSGQAPVPLQPPPVSSQAGASPSEPPPSGSTQQQQRTSSTPLRSSDPSRQRSSTLGLGSQPLTSSSLVPSGSSELPSSSLPLTGSGSLPLPAALPGAGGAPSEGPAASAAPGPVFQLPAQPSLSIGPTGSQATRGSSHGTSGQSGALDPSSRVRKRRFEAQFEDLQQHYLRMRQRQLVGRPPDDAPAAPAAASAAAAPAAAAAAAAAEGRAPGPADGGGGGRGTAAELHEFSRMLAMFTHASQLKVLAAMPGASQRTSAAIVSSIAFDRDARVFSTAGVSKRISMFRLADVLEAGAASAARQAPNAPAAELLSRSKLSCVCWSRFRPQQLASSDYEGCVTLWDAAAGQPVAEYEAHDKRIWSVDFSPSDADVFASGSDDGYVKVWSARQAGAVAELDMRANVCCVCFSPGGGHELAVGSADHNVHLYDTRHTQRALHVFPGHRKAVSYVRWTGGGELVSASTDSTLRSWAAAERAPLRTFCGHANEKHFVGLSTAGSFVACGSETCEVFVYHRSMSRPVARRLLAPPAPAPTDSGGAQSLGGGLQFVSSVCWQPDSQVLLAATSQGAIQVLQLAS